METDEKNVSKRTSRNRDATPTRAITKIRMRTRRNRSQMHANHAFIRSLTCTTHPTVDSSRTTKATESVDTTNGGDVVGTNWLARRARMLSLVAIYRGSRLSLLFSRLASFMAPRVLCLRVSHGV